MWKQICLSQYFVLLEFFKNYVCQFKKLKQKLNNYRTSKTFLLGLAFHIIVLSFCQPLKKEVEIHQNHGKLVI